MCKKLLTFTLTFATKWRVHTKVILYSGHMIAIYFEHVFIEPILFQIT